MIIPTDAMQVEIDTRLKPGTYYVPNGLDILEDGITLDGSGAVLVGKAHNGTAVRLHNRKNVTIKNLRIMNYKFGIEATCCQQIAIEDCTIRDTAEVQANTIFLDVWRNVEHSYGGGILLEKVSDSLVQHCDLQHQMTGLHAYHCHSLTVQNCNASYNSGWGFHLYETSDSTFEHNYADYCCRYEPRGPNHGHMGADSAGFLIVHNSCRNTFRHNSARLSGDGFFLAGMSPTPTNDDFEPCGCNDNLFEDNDASLSPNIAFEATFCRGNIFRRNHACQSNYGFWLGFSTANLIEENVMTGNRTAGIAVENGVEMRATANNFEDNRYGVLLWSKRLPAFETYAAHNDTSRDWLIESNTFRWNRVAVRIAADQDHGIKALPGTGEYGFPAPAPSQHRMRNNQFQGNGQDFDLQGDIDTIIE
jgi:parallel beta-helix repeat protein